MAAAQETMAAASTYLYAGNIPIGEEFFRQKRCAEEGLGRVALVVTLDCKLFRRLPRAACYTARLLKKPTSILEGLEAKGHDVRVEA